MINHTCLKHGDETATNFSPCVACEHFQAMLGEIAMALLTDRVTTHQRDDWAPVLKRLELKYKPECG